MKTIIRVSFKGECDDEILPVFNYLNFLSLFGSMELIWTIVSVSQLEKPSLHAWLFIHQFLKNFNVKIVEYLLPISKLNKPIYNYCLLDVTQASFIGAYQLFVWLLRHGSVFKTLYTTHNLWRLGSKMQASRIVEHIMVTYILLVYNCFYELGYWLTRHGQPVCKAINTRKHILKCRE